MHAIRVGATGTVRMAMAVSAFKSRMALLGCSFDLSTVQDLPVAVTCVHV